MLNAALSPDALLALWEQGLGAPATRRGEALLQAAAGDTSATLGAHNRRLLGLHTQWFGAAIELLSHCPACATAVQFGSDGEALLHGLADAPAEASHRLNAAGHTLAFRLPAAADVADAAEESDAFVQRLLDRCVLAAHRNDLPDVPVHALPEPVRAALAERMEALDPAASIAFALACPQCGTQWTAPLDVGQLLWKKLQAAAERLLLDVDTLARAYGWTEPEVLRLPPLRRAAYLQLAQAFDQARA